MDLTSTTKIADVIQPEIFTQYVINRTMELSELIESGIAEHSAEFDALASGPNTLIHMPFWNDLTGEPEIMDDKGHTVPGKLSTGQDIARKIAFTKSFGANALVGHLAGDDPMRVIADRFAVYWNRVYQKVLLKQLEGVFTSAKMKDKVLDITKLSDEKALISGDTFLDACQLMGDAKDSITAVMMNSAVETKLRKLDLLERTEALSAMGKPIYTFMGHRVVVDDAMKYDKEKKEAEMYLFGNGAIAWGNGHDSKIKETEVVRDGLSLAGEDILVNRKISILHPRGIKFTESSVAGTFPTIAELAKGTNWERVYEPKAIRISKFAFKTDNVGA